MAPGRTHSEDAIDDTVRLPSAMHWAQCRRRCFCKYIFWSACST